MSAECRERHITWSWEMEEEPGLIPIDKNQMEQVFVNILRNSIEAIGENGAIAIRMGKRSGRSYVEVEDTGRGISPEVRADLFTPFYSTKENGRGIGTDNRAGDPDATPFPLFPRKPARKPHAVHHLVPLKTAQHVGIRRTFQPAWRGQRCA